MNNQIRYQVAERETVDVGDPSPASGVDLEARVLALEGIAEALQIRLNNLDLHLLDLAEVIDQLTSRIGAAEELITALQARDSQLDQLQQQLALLLENNS